MLGEQGGWPLTMFLTPDGEPVWGGTYFPKTARYGRPAFLDVLREIARLFRDEPQRIDKNRLALMARLAEKARPPGATVGPRELDDTARQIAGAVDPINGGLRGAPKFPQPAGVRIPLARRAAHAATSATSGSSTLTPGAHVPRRHLRPSRRRLLALLGRRQVAGATFREDALRQCPAPRTAGARASAHRQAAVIAGAHRKPSAGSRAR